MVLMYQITLPYTVQQVQTVAVPLRSRCCMDWGVDGDLTEIAHEILHSMGEALPSPGAH
jgi:hypothetical protein